MSKVVRKYLGIVISKKEQEVIEFIQTGSNHFWDAYYIHSQRRKRINRPTKTITSWFNRTIKALHSKGLLQEITFAYEVSGGGYIWINPGINASRLILNASLFKISFKKVKVNLIRFFNLNLYYER